MTERRESRAAGKAKRAAKELPLDTLQGEAAPPTFPDAGKPRKPPMAQSRASRAATAKGDKLARTESPPDEAAVGVAAPAPLPLGAKTDRKPPIEPSKPRARGKAKTREKKNISPDNTDRTAALRLSRSGAEAEQPPPYLAALLGQPVDEQGEPIGAGSSKMQSDTELQAYALQLWRQMQSGRVVNRYTRAIERAGLATNETWAVEIDETRSTSSTPDELRRYRQKTLFRANLLEAILSETVADLRRLEGMEPTSSEKSSEPA